MMGQLFFSKKISRQIDIFNRFVSRGEIKVVLNDFFLEDKFLHFRGLQQFSNCTEGISSVTNFLDKFGQNFKNVIFLPLGT